MSRNHLYYPVLSNGHALVTAARIWFFQPGTTALVPFDIWDSEDEGSSLPNPWTITPAIIDAWFTEAVRVRLQVQEYAGNIYFIEDVDILPPADRLFFSDTTLAITGGWSNAGVLMATSSVNAQWSTSYFIHPADAPAPPVVLPLGPGEGTGGGPSTTDQTVTWNRIVRDVTVGYGYPDEQIKFRLDNASGQYLFVHLFVDSGGTAQATCALNSDTFSDIFRDSFTNITVYNNTLGTTVVTPVNGEEMTVTVIGNTVDIYQASVSPTTSIMSFTVDVTDGTDHAFQSFYLDPSHNPVDDSSAVIPQWNTGSPVALFPQAITYPGATTYSG